MIAEIAFKNDFCSHLSRSGHLIEIADEYGKKGAKHYEALTPEVFSRLARRKINQFILGSITPRDSGKVKRQADDIKSKNYVAFDLDLKEAGISGYEGWDTATKRQEVIRLFNSTREAIELSGLGPVWFVSFTGNGMHLWFKCKEPITIASKESYSAFYLSCLARLDKAIGRPLDDQLTDPNRIMRLPLSYNCKKEPVPTEVIYHNLEADSSTELHGLLLSVASIKQSNSNRREAKRERAQAHSKRESTKDSHIENLKANLTFEAVLNHFGYSKWASAKKTADGWVISSPWADDNTPSCHLNELGGWFKCFSTGNKGDILTFVAKTMGTNTKDEWPKVVREAEKITGIRPKAKESSESKQEFFYKDFVPLFEKELPQVGKCLLSNKLRYKHQGHWPYALEKPVIEYLKSRALDVGLPKRDVECHLYRYETEKEPALLINFPDWDKTDHIKAMADAITCGNVSKAQFEEFLKDWLTKMVKRVSNPDIQNESLILLGKQGKGKDTFIKNLLRDGLVNGLYYSNVKLSENELDDYRIARASIGIHIEEYDCTNKKNLAHWKAFQTADSKTYVEKYKTNAEKHTLRHSIIASCNNTIQELLRDPTGSRRYRVFEVDHIDFNYPDDKSPQIIAQAYALAEMGFSIQPETKQVMDDYLAKHRPKKLEEQVCEYFDELMYRLEILETVIRGATADDIKKQVAIYFQISSDKVAKILKAHDRSDRDNKGAYYYLPHHNPKKTK